jgi:hypothetical protein
MADLDTLPAWQDRVLTPGGQSLEQNYYAFLKSIVGVIADLQGRSTMIVKAGAPVPADVPDGQFRIIKDTTGPTYSLVVNDGGTLKSVALT